MATPLPHGLEPLLRVIIFATLALAACGGDDGTGPSTQQDLGDIVGRWEFTMESRAGVCTGAVGGGELYVSLPLPSGYESSETSLANWGSATWGFDATDPTDFPLTGNTRPSAKTIDLRIWKSVLVTGSQLVGTISEGSFEGDLIDPAPGMEPNSVLGTCTFPTTGRRLSATP